MSVKKFRFVSPGIFINEIDRSQLPAEPARMGPVVIGRSEKGPGFEPTTVSSFAEFVEIFGNPIPGKEGTDVWRNGNYNGPTYAAYAAQAYLRHSSPVTFVRLLGDQHDQADAWANTTISQHGPAGWSTKNLIGDGGGTYGLFIMPSSSIDEAQYRSGDTSPGGSLGATSTTVSNITGTLAAVWYLNEGYMWLTGTLRGTESKHSRHQSDRHLNASGSSVLLGCVGNKEWKVIIKDTDDNEIYIQLPDARGCPCFHI